jgi:hypothetical protein
MTARTYASIVGALLALGAFIALLIPVTVDDGGEAISCGNGIVSKTRNVEMYDAGREIGRMMAYGEAEESTLAAQCEDAIGIRRAWSWPACGIGVVVFFGGMLIQPKRPAPAERDA